MARLYVPTRGDVIWITFTPQVGHEQSGHRPALVLSPSSYNGQSRARDPLSNYQPSQRVSTGSRDTDRNKIGRCCAPTPLSLIRWNTSGGIGNTMNFQTSVRRPSPS
jgi:PemK-like, MazF-like toxin of type II toxin-antitoxin system